MGKSFFVSLTFCSFFIGVVSLSNVNGAGQAQSSNAADSEIAYGYYYGYPDPESQPGMSDDSNALYHSYLRSNQAERNPENFARPSRQARAYADEAHGHYNSQYESYLRSNEREEYPQGYYRSNDGNQYYSAPPYPDAESQPGMGDDSNELYRSYLRSNQQGR